MEGVELRLSCQINATAWLETYMYTITNPFFSAKCSQEFHIGTSTTYMPSLYKCLLRDLKQPEQNFWPAVLLKNKYYSSHSLFSFNAFIHFIAHVKFRNYPWFPSVTQTWTKYSYPWANFISSTPKAFSNFICVSSTSYISTLDKATTASHLVH